MMINPNYVDGLELKIKELAAERDAALAHNAELVAQVDSLKSAIQMACDAFRMYEMSTDDYPSFAHVGMIEKLHVSLDETPAQRLRHIQADAGRAAIYALFEAGNCQQYENGAGDGFIECGDALKFADQYAAKVRKGGE